MRELWVRMKTERQKMAAGEWYTCLDDELEAPRVTARSAVHQHNILPPEARGAIGPKLSQLIKAKNAIIEAPFHCAYGINIELGDRVFLNAGCTILDCATVTISDHCQLGPNVQIYCADCAQGVRIRSKQLDDGTRVRVCSKCDVTIERQ
jgi:maltose O-acetyltransferase